MIINELANKYKVSIRTLRYYEEIGLLFSTRNYSNVREFNPSQVERLELILFFKNLNFKLEEIKEILQIMDFDKINLLFENKMTELTEELNRLSNQKQILISVLKVFNTKDKNKISIKEFIKEQIYFQSKNERMLIMNNQDKIILEIGKDLISLADKQVGGTLLNSITAMRTGLEKQLNVVIDPIRIRDNLAVLTEKEYRILKDGNEVFRKIVVGDSHIDQENCILADLRKIIL